MMAWLDSLLNLACLLLGWAAWSLRGELKQRGRPATLAGTLRPVLVPTARVWFWALGAVGLLGLRALLVWHGGRASEWVPRLDLGVVSVAFPVLPGWSGLGLAMVHAVLSFGVLCTGFWLWMVLLDGLAEGGPAVNPFVQMARSVVGPWRRWPVPVRLLGTPLVVAALWLGMEPVLVALRLLPEPAPWPARMLQALVVGLNAWLVWKPLLTGLLLLYWLNLYIYFGSHPFWEFVGWCGRRLVAPWRRLGFQIRQLDLTPLVLVAGVWGVSHVAEHGILFRGLDRGIPGLAEVYVMLAR
ncbi:hypothetical protein [Limisphaera sp. VF-2]|uniref:hypothetical protein n=1 Tax=Limisphaera sp. VF-2 TaxID=3400418 RepID=UPI001757C0CE